jgi:maleylpyruvate isomerase
MIDTELDETIASCQAAHRSLSASVDGLTDADARRPSLLPRWTVGHVLTHLARNADSHVRMLEGALRGEALEQYAGGFEQRSADIDAGAGRPAAALVDDVRATAARLEATWAAMTPTAWDDHGLARGRAWPCRSMPFHRLREVEVHHVDLGLGYDATRWSDGYVAQELPRALATLPHRLHDPVARRLLVAWLLDRGDEPVGLELDGWQAGQDRALDDGRAR